MNRCRTKIIAYRSVVILAVVLIFGSALAFFAQAPTKEELASKALHWDEPADPIHIAGPLYNSPGL